MSGVLLSKVLCYIVAFKEIKSQSSEYAGSQKSLCGSLLCKQDPVLHQSKNGACAGAGEGVGG